MLIEEYFQRIKSIIANFPFIYEYNLHFEKRSSYLGFIEGEILFSGGISLKFIEYVNVKYGVKKYKYSYHVQDSKAKLVFRYDMAPHHGEINSFPHHKHLQDGNIIGSDEPSLEDILYEISELI